MIVILSSLTLLTACNGVKWNSDILGGASHVPTSTPGQPLDGGDPGAPLSAIPSEAASDAALAVDVSAAIDANSSAVQGYSGRASTVASLGDPSIPGLWMETPLVRSEQLARLRSGKGKEVTVTLRPIAGETSSGSRLSISAMRALGAPLTELVELQVLPAS